MSFVRFLPYCGTATSALLKRLVSGPQGLSFFRMERESVVAEEKGFAKGRHMDDREIEKSVVTKTRIDGGMMLSEKRVPKKERMHRFSLQGDEGKPQFETEAARRNAWLKVKVGPLAEGS